MEFHQIPPTALVSNFRRALSTSTSNMFNSDNTLESSLSLGKQDGMMVGEHSKVFLKRSFYKVGTEQELN